MTLTRQAMKTNHKSSSDARPSNPATQCLCCNRQVKRDCEVWLLGLTPEQWEMVERFHTLSEFSKAVNAPYTSLLKLVKDGYLKPDAMTGSSYLFHHDRVASVRRLLKKTQPTS